MWFIAVACGGQTRELDILELKSRAFVSHLPGFEGPNSSPLQEQCEFLAAKTPSSSLFPFIIYARVLLCNPVNPLCSPHWSQAHSNVPASTFNLLCREISGFYFLSYGLYSWAQTQPPPPTMGCHCSFKVFSCCCSATLALKFRNVKNPPSN